MPRKKPTSAKQHKAELQLKRAVKRGDVPAPPKQSAKRRVRPGGRGERSTDQSAGVSGGVSTKKLESSFLKMGKEWLEHARLVAATTTLVRPIPSEAVVLDLSKICGETDDLTLSAPKRPKWRYDQTKKEVEKNEEGLFSKWIRESDDNVRKWQRAIIQYAPSNVEATDEKEPSSPSFERSPTYFERNLEVWRQL